MTIKLPELNWFHQKQDKWHIINTFTGSMGANPNSGSVNRKTLNYKIKVKVNEDDSLVFLVESYIRHPWNVSPQKTEEKTREFPFTKEGMEEIISWLDAEYEAGIK